MSTTTGLMTVEEFLKLPDPREGHLELHHGEVITVPPVQFEHTSIQYAIQILLVSAGREYGRTHVEMPFQPEPEYEMWVADVAFVSKVRVAATLAEKSKYLQGAPDLVVEVLSPSQDAADLFDKERICLNNGCKAFWIVDPINKQVKVTTPDFKTTTYRPGESIPAIVFPGSIEVDAIFSQEIP